jgi:hypothetical protein
MDYPWNTDERVPFLERHFPFQFLVLIPFLRRFLPKEAFLIYCAWKKEQLW